MSIQVLCPNGHLLQVKEAYAGRTGLCPVCRAQVQIPKPRQPELTEDTILEFLGPPKRIQLSAVSGGPPGWDSRSAAAPSPSPPKKSCDKCNREILAETHICPYCHTYIAGLADF